jgi:hypothetical protein
LKAFSDTAATKLDYIHHHISLMSEKESELMGKKKEKEK